MIALKGKGRDAQVLLKIANGFLADHIHGFVATVRQIPLPLPQRPVVMIRIIAERQKFELLFRGRDWFPNQRQFAFGKNFFRETKMQVWCFKPRMGPDEHG